MPKRRISFLLSLSLVSCRTGAAAWILLCTASVSGAQSLASHPIWQGELEVQAQDGSLCAATPEPPYRVNVTLAALNFDSATGVREILAWGDMQTAWLNMSQSEPTRFSIALEQPDRTSGNLSVSRLDQEAIVGHWAEDSIAGSPGCRWTQGALRAHSVLDQAAAGNIYSYANQLVAAEALMTQLRAATKRSQVAEPARQLAQLASKLAAGGEAHQSVAQWLLDAGEIARVARQYESAASLYAHSTAMYRRLADRLPEFAALAFAKDAALKRRLKDMDGAYALMDEGVATLRSSGRMMTDAASGLLNTLGAWRLSAGQTGEALALFAEAAQADKARNAPRDEVISLNNLAQALENSGQLEAAEAAYKQALGVMQHLPTENSESLHDLIETNAESLRRRREMRDSQSA